MSGNTGAGESIEDRVFEAAKSILSEREHEMSEAQAWATGTEIASVTDIEKGEVLRVLRALGAGGRLRIKEAAAEQEIEVLGVDHGAGADSLEEPVDEE